MQTNEDWGSRQYLMKLTQHRLFLLKGARFPCGKIDACLIP